MSVLSGFADGDAWRYAADGTIVGRAKDRTYAQVARDGVPVEVLISESVAPPVESCIVAPIAAPLCHSALKEASCNCEQCQDARAVADIWGWSAATPEDEFDGYFEPVMPRSKARAARTLKRVGGGATKPSKIPRLPKYGPKVTKLRTAAADAEAKAVAAPMPSEEPAACTILKPTGNRCACCNLVQDVGEYCYCIIKDVRPCHHCDSLFASALAKAKRDAADWFAYLDELFEEDKLERRIRDARYERR
jgi:hypothetical protein